MLGKVAGGLLVGFILYFLIKSSYWRGYCCGYKDAFNNYDDIKVGGTD